jgi:C1A family cysteine protease
VATIEEITRAIAARAYGTWIAGDTDVWRRASGDTTAANSLFGLRVGDRDQQLRAAADSQFDELTAPPPPRSIDWRTKTGGYVTPIKDHGRCGACVAFATCAAMESAHLIHASIREPLSEGHLFHCGGGSCSNGWEYVEALGIASNGVGRQIDLPWNPDGECVKIAPFLRISRFRVHTALNSRKRALSAGPVMAGLKVYEDLLAYTSGIYSNVIGDFRGNHGVCLVGYDDDAGCWIVKNSWGAGFGEAGFFRIAYGQCGIDTDFAFYSVEVEGCT